MLKGAAASAMQIMPDGPKCRVRVVEHVDKPAVFVPAAILRVQRLVERRIVDVDF